MSQSLSPFSDAGVSPDGFALPSGAVTVRPDFESMPPGKAKWDAMRAYYAKIGDGPQTVEEIAREQGIDLEHSGKRFCDADIDPPLDLTDEEFESFMDAIKEIRRMRD